MPVFQGLTQHLKNVAAELRQFVQEEDAVVGQADLARSWHRLSPNQAGIADRVMWGTERALHDQCTAPVQRARDAVDLGDFDGFVESQGGKDRGQALRNHRFSATGCADE